MCPVSPHILAINGGSSSIQFALFEAASALGRTVSGSIGLSNATLRVESTTTADCFSRTINALGQAAAASILIDWIADGVACGEMAGVGHGMVRGGTKYCEPQQITTEMFAELRRLTPFDPGQLPEELMLTEAFHDRFPHLPQVACFDKAFHHDMPRVAQMLPIPRRYEAEGVRRYGFHGLSYSFLIEELIGENAPLVRERICDGLGFLGIELDLQRNVQNAVLISPDAGNVKVRVIHKDEELMIAKSAIRILNLDPRKLAS